MSFKGYLLILGFLPVFVLTACSTVHQNPSDNSVPELKKQISEIQKNQSADEAKLSELTNEISALKTLPATPAPAEKPQASVKPAPPHVAPIMPATAHNPIAQMYDETVSESSKNQLAEEERDVGVMLKKYKDSPYTSNALYLYAEALFDHGNYVKSAEEFEHLYKTFPDGNKAVGSLYKLALCYQKLGHPAEAQETFENIVALYPGSREALDSEKQILGKTP